MKLLARALVTTILLATPLVTLAQRFTEAQMVQEPWIRGALMSSLTLSPDGRHAAGIAYGGHGTAAILISTDTGHAEFLAKPEPDPRYRFGQVPIAVHWVASDLLVVDYNNRESVSVDLAGKPIAKLGERFIRRMSESGPLAESVLVYRDVDDGDIDQVNARTGSRQRYRVSIPGKPMAWAFDESGDLRAITMMDSSRWTSKSKISNWYRSSGTEAWQLLQEWPATAVNEVWYPLSVLPQANSLAVLSRHERDTLAVFRYDAATRQHAEVMAAHARDDILHVAGLDQQNVERVVTGGLRAQTFWFDPRWASLQASIDAALPGRTNHLQGNKNGRVLVTSTGDVDPGRWYVLDTNTAKFREIAAVRPELDPASMRPMQTMRYASRDGLSIPAYLTLPAGSVGQPAPTVVLIHGGPNVRDRWTWDAEVQMLAKAGYAVFQPQFRGSAGFGRSFEEAGYRQWGRGMQDDITDGVKDLIAKGVTDPTRVCIFGASYGGYAAMWGTIKTPDLYRCGISFAGISDLADLLSSGLWDDSTAVSREISRDRVGDPEKDKGALDEVSPLKHAGRVRAPLLMIHGEEDLRVLPSQSKAMVASLRQAGRPVEWLPLEDEGHSLNWVKSRVRYYTAVLNFLDRHLAPNQPASLDADPPSRLK
jgi:dienelactone hydrolase